MALGQSTHDGAGDNVERGIQTGGAMAFVVVGSSLDLPGLEGQQRLRTVERLDLGLLVHAKHHRVVRRIEVEAHDIDHLVGELRVLADLEGLETVRFEVCGLPDLSHLPRRDPGGLGHQTHTPMGGLMGDALDRKTKNLFGLGLGELFRLPGARQVPESIHAVAPEPSPPLVDRAKRGAGDLGHDVRRFALRAQQHDLRPAGQTLGRFGRTKKGREGLLLGLGNLVNVMCACHAS